MRPPLSRQLSRGLHLALPLLLLSLVVVLAGANNLVDDARALLAFRAAVGRHLPWNERDPGSACSWSGVTCNHQGARTRVTALRLPGAALSGQLPTGTLGNLTALRSLSLRLNALSGRLPTDLASAAALRHVFLDGNRLSGDFPRAFLALRGLARLALGGNNLSGHIPAALGNLTGLRTLLLQRNRFVGRIPEMTLPVLEQFNVSFNPLLTGPIPVELCRMPRSAFLGTGLEPCPDEASPSPAQAGRRTTPPV